MTSKFNIYRGKPKKFENRFLNRENTRPPSKFETKNLNLKTKSLFYEFYLDDDPIYTLQDVDRKVIKRDPISLEIVKEVVIPSLFRLYMEENDPTEYAFASKYLHSWDHWQKICKASWFKNDYLRRWRKELELQQKASALKNIIREASSTSKNSFQANKFLYEKSIGLDAQGNPKTDKKGIRVTDKEIFDQVRLMTETQTEEDYDRLLKETVKQERAN